MNAGHVGISGKEGPVSMSGVHGSCVPFPLPRPGKFGKFLAVVVVAVHVDIGSCVVAFSPQKPPIAKGLVLYSRGGVESVMDNPSLVSRGCLGVGLVCFPCRPPG